MDTNIKYVADLLACVITADGSYEEAEKETVGEIADALGYDEKELLALVEERVEDTAERSEDELNALLDNCAEEVADDEVEVIFEAMLQMVLCDGVMTFSESEILHAIGEALGLAPAMITMLTADMVKNEPELELDFGSEGEEE